MENSLNFLYIVFFISIIMLTIAGFVAAAFVIPLQVKEAGVRNGLAKLRKQLLLKGFLTFGIITVAIIVLSLRYIIHDTNILRYIITSLIFLYSFFFLVQVYVDYMIYTQQYTEESKKLHDKIDKLEKKK